MHEGAARFLRKNDLDPIISYAGVNKRRSTDSKEFKPSGRLPPKVQEDFGMLTKLRSKLLGSRIGGRKWYQSVELVDGASSTTTTTHERAQRRTNSFSRWIPKIVEPTDHVVDLGCNAGLFCCEAAQICDSVVGVEIDKDFVAQARLLLENWKKRGKKVDNVEIVHGDVTEDLSLLKDTTLLFASKVLYHKGLGDRLHVLMEGIRQSKIDRILAQGHTTQGELGSYEGMERLFAKYGFSTEMLEDVFEYPIVLARRAA